MVNRIIDILNRSVVVILSVSLVCILLIDIIFQNKEYYLKKEFLINNSVIMAIVLVVFFALYLIYKKFLKQKKIYFNIYLATILLFIIQVFICYNVLFVTNTWDEKIILESAKELIGTGVVERENYFSYFPNNQFFLFLIVQIMRVCNWFGIMYTEYALLVCAIIQCVILAVAGMLTYFVVLDQTKSKGYALIVWIIYFLSIGLSAWSLIIYTDMASLIFPVFIIYLYQLTKNRKNLLLKWFFIFFCLIIGFKIKPTVLIVGIAIIVTESINFLKNINKEKIICSLKIVGVSIIAIVAALLVVNLSLKSLKISIDNDKNTGVAHMLMMGINPDTNGAFNLNDVDLSTNTIDKEKRKQAQIDTIKKRLKDLGVGGVIRFYGKKAIMIFNDGTYAMGEESGTYDIVYEDKIPVVSYFLKNVFYSHGKYFPLLATMQQIIWIGMLLISTLGIFLKKEKRNILLAMSLFGIILFDMLFEARARYFFIYVPILMIYSVECLKAVISKFDEIIKIKEQNKCLKKN